MIAVIRVWLGFVREAVRERKRWLANGWNGLTDSGVKWEGVE